VFRVWVRPEFVTRTPGWEQIQAGSETMSSMGEAPAAPPAVLQSVADSRDLIKWQKKLLPFTTRFLAVLAIAFFALSIFDVYEMRSFVKSEDGGSIREQVQNALRAQNVSAAPDVVPQSLLMMEADAMDKRYRQATALLMSRIWTRQLAFLTGMVLTFIGALFILSKLSESRSDVNVGMHDWKGGISSSSPGLILAFFGSALIAISLVVQPPISVQDRPIYFAPIGVVSNPEAGKAQPASAMKTAQDPIDLFPATVTGEPTPPELAKKKPRK